MATGRGSSLGRALIDLYRQTSGTVRRSYTRTGWHAQLSALTATAAGRAAADAAGLTATRRTLTDWLSQRTTPTPANRAKIREAYEAMRGGFRVDAVAVPIRITGRVTLGRDSRIRGGPGGGGPLLVNGKTGDWRPIARDWDDGELDPDVHEALFVDHVIDRDYALASVSDGSWRDAFNGAWYEVRT